MTFNTEVIGCYWQQDRGEWKVPLRQKLPDGEIKEFKETGNILLHGTGILNNFKWPEIEGIEKFKGKVRLLGYHNSITTDLCPGDPYRTMAQRLSKGGVEE